MTSPMISSTDLSGGRRRGWRPGPPLLGLLAGWVALFSWSGMVARPWDFLVPTLFVGVLMALAGSLAADAARRAVRRRGGAGRDRAALPERDLRGRTVAGSG